MVRVFRPTLSTEPSGECSILTSPLSHDSRWDVFGEPSGHEGDRALGARRPADPTAVAQFLVDFSGLSNGQLALRLHGLHTFDFWDLLPPYALNAHL